MCIGSLVSTIQMKKGKLNPLKIVVSSDRKERLMDEP